MSPVPQLCLKFDLNAGEEEALTFTISQSLHFTVHTLPEGHLLWTSAGGDISTDQEPDPDFVQPPEAPVPDQRSQRVCLSTYF
jgi:hypothetical protein